MIKNVKPDADSLLFSEFAPEDEMQEAMFDLLEARRVPTDTIQRLTEAVVSGMDNMKQLSAPSDQEGYVEVHIEVDDSRFHAKVEQVARQEFTQDLDGSSAKKQGEHEEKEGLNLASLQEQMDEVKLNYRDGFHTTLELIRYLG